MPRNEEWPKKYKDTGLRGMLMSVSFLMRRNGHEKSDNYNAQMPKLAGNYNQGWWNYVRDISKVIIDELASFKDAVKERLASDSDDSDTPSPLKNENLIALEEQITSLHQYAVSQCDTEGTGTSTSTEISEDYSTSSPPPKNLHT